MRAGCKWLALATAAAVALACENVINPEDITLQDLVGTWRATKLEFTPDAGGASYDLIANGGSLVITLGSDGRFSGQLSFASDTDNFSGSIALSAGKLILTDDDDPNDPTTFSMTLSGNTLTLTTTDAEFDFNFDGQDEAADAVLVLVRQ